MVETGADRPDFAERISRRADVAADAWAATLEDMHAIAEDLEDEGWETLAIQAGDTAPEPPEAGPEGRFGLSYVVPGDDAERFEELFEPGAFPAYEVHRARAAGRLFLVTTLLDPDRKVAILLAGNVELRHAPDCVAAAVEHDEMYTHVQTLDGTHVGSFRHEEYEQFFPDPDRLMNWATAEE
ncbi:MAG: hypothetical protein ABEI39_06500 [Halobacteriales archaeon]